MDFVEFSLLVRSVVGLCLDNTSSRVKLETGRFNVSLFLALHSYLPLSLQTADFIMRSDLRLEKTSKSSCTIELDGISTVTSDGDREFRRNAKVSLTVNGQKCILFYSYLSIGHL